jgi:hypothetical protein
MILRQTLHTSPAIASSYLFGCGSKGVGVGVVVDPAISHDRRGAGRWWESIGSGATSVMSPALCLRAQLPTRSASRQRSA